MDFSRMVLLSEELYTSLKHNNINEPALSAIEKIQNTPMSDEKRLILESNIVQRFTKSSTPNHNADWIDTAILQFPKTNRTRAKQLFAYLKQNLPSPQWNERGEIMDKSSHEIRNSNILDLLSYATANKTSLREPPLGYDIFHELMREANVPKHLLNTKAKHYQLPNQMQWESYR